jgi:hypothetical protein
MKTPTNIRERIDKILDDAEYLDYGEEHSIFHGSEAVDQLVSLMQQSIDTAVREENNQIINIIRNWTKGKNITKDNLRHLLSEIKK